MRRISGLEQELAVRVADKLKHRLREADHGVAKKFVEGRRKMASGGTACYADGGDVPAEPPRPVPLPGPGAPDRERRLPPDAPKTKKRDRDPEMMYAEGGMAGEDEMPHKGRDPDAGNHKTYPMPGNYAMGGDVKGMDEDPDSDQDETGESPDEPTHDLEGLLHAEDDGGEDNGEAAVHSTDGIDEEEAREKRINDLRRAMGF